MQVKVRLMKKGTHKTFWRGFGPCAFLLPAVVGCFFTLPTPLAGAEQPIVIQASKGKITGPFLVSNGWIIHSTPAGLTQGGRAVYEFTTTEPGTYAVVVVLKGNGATNNVVHVGIDKEEFVSETDGKWQFTAKPLLQTIPVGCRSSEGDRLTRGSPTRFKLEPGKHKLVVQGRTAGVEIQSFTLQRTPEPPGAPRIAVRP
jgi:hypothetical protein